MIAAMPSAEAISVQQWIMLAAIALIVLVYLLTRGQRRVRDGSPKQYRREIDTATAQSEAVKRDMEELLVELEELSRKINGQIDANLEKLRETTLDADRRITALRVLIAESKRLAGEAEAYPPQADATGASAAEIPQNTTPEPAPPESPAAQPVGSLPVMPEQRHQRIYELADRGLTALQIAQQLETQPGEIELILNLRKVES